MLIIPAIDIRRGECVMLYKGKLQYEKKYSSDPAFIAKLWYLKGAQRIHVVDIDGAFCGVVRNWDTLRSIRKSVDCEIQFGGGVRNEESIEQLIKLGIDKIIISTMFVYNPKLACKVIKKYPRKIILAFDISNEAVNIAGWKERTSLTIYECIDKARENKVKEIIVTDIERNGTMDGVDIELMRKIKEHATDINLIFSGGIGSIEDIKKVKSLNPYGLILGKALYEERVHLEEAIQIAKEQ